MKKEDKTDFLFASICISFAIIVSVIVVYQKIFFQK